MKKSIFLFFAAILCASSAWALGYNDESHVYLKVNGTTKYYKVSQESWGTGCSLPGEWGGELKSQTFNSVLNLQVVGGAVGGWTNNGEKLSATLSYAVTKNTSTPSSWTSFGSISTSSQYNGGNNCFYYKNNGSANVTPTTPGTYYLHIKISFNSTNKTSYVKFVVPPFTVAGSSAILGSEWDVNDTSNDMTYSSGTTYTLTKSNVSLTKGETYQCKVVINHSWDESYPPQNLEFTVDATGHYDITFSFDASKKTLSVSKNRLYAINYNGNGNTSGSVPTTTYHASGSTVTAANNSGNLTKENYNFAGWNTKADGTGTDYVAGSGTFTMPTADLNLYAKWTEITHTVTFTNDGNGTTNQTGAIEVGVITGIAIDATPNTDYEFKVWESSNGGTFATTADVANNTFYPTANTTLTATFRSIAVNALLVVAGANIESVAGSIDPVVLGESYEIKATPAYGYKFNLWTAEPAENAAFDNASSATTQVKVQNGSVTVTASATEILAELTTANAFDAGAPSIAAPTASATKIGVATTATVSATAVPSGYKFTGWTLTNCERIGGSDKDLSITVKSTGTDAAATAIANYEINKYYIIGSFNGWSKSDANYEMTYDNGVYKKEVTLEKDAEFKINDGADAWWGYDNLKGVTYKELAKPDDSDNIKVTAEGSITFTIVFNLSKHLITFEGLTNKYSYVLMGVDGDWDTGIELALNPDATNEYVLKNQIIRSATDAVKVVTLDEGSKIAENNTVKDGSVEHTLTDEYQNIVLADGVYNFWFNVWDGIYIEKSAAEDLTLTGVTKTIFNPSWGKKYTSLDLGENSIQILNGADAFGYGTYDVQAYLADDEITVAGFGTWEVVEGVETLTATLVDDEKTKVYNLTATVAAIETYNLTCDDAHYYKPNMMETIFVGEVDGETLTVSVESLVVGENNNVLGIYGETDFLAETVTISVSGLTTYVLTGAFKDATGNIYNVSMTATPLPKTPVVVENATYTEVDGDIIITGDWSGTELTVTLYGYATSDNVLYEEAEMETDDIWAASTEVTLNKTADAFTITGEFIHGWEAAIYNVTISGTLPVPTPDYTRTTTAGKFGTICLPFGSTNYTGMELYECVGKETGKVYIASVTTLEAGVPYIFLATGTELAVYSDGTTAASPGDHNGLHGTFTDDTEVAVGNYILKDNELRESDGNAKVNANRAYLVMSDVPAGAPQQMPGRKYIGMSTKGENATTGLDNITNGENITIKVIENGQLIIIRNGEKFNAQGVRF